MNEKQNMILTCDDWYKEQLKMIECYKCNKSLKKKYNWFTRGVFNNCIPFLCCPCIINSCLCRFVVCELNGNEFTVNSDSRIYIFYREINEDLELDIKWLNNIDNIPKDELTMVIIIIRIYLDIYEEKKSKNCNFIENVLNIYRKLFSDNIYWELKGSLFHDDYKKFLENCRRLLTNL